MKKQLFYLASVLIFSGCDPSYHNKELYNIKIGEKFEVYVAENSCCIYSWANKATAKKIRMVEERLVKSADNDCDGCSSLYGWVFEGISEGVDTIKIANIPAGGRHEYLLNSDIYIKSIYIVNVSK